MQTWNRFEGIRMSGALIAVGVCATIASAGDCELGWDPTLGQPGFDASARAVVSYNGQIVVGGQFNSPAGKVFYWDGSTWQVLGGGVSGNSPLVYNMTVYQGDLIVCGKFTHAGGVPANNIARWDGASWHALGDGLECGPGGCNLPGRELYALGDDLYVGGDFTLAGGSPANHVARWDGTDWHPIGEGVNDNVYAIYSYDGDLYVGGEFTVAGTESCNAIARWDGAQWLPVGDGTTPGRWVMEMIEYGGDLIVVGSFTTGGGALSDGIQRWDGSAWHPIGANNWAEELLIHNGKLIVSGGFTSIGGTAATRIATWDGTTWAPIGAGADNWIVGLAEHNDDVIAVGAFTMMDGQSANRVASLTSVGEGPDLALSPNTVVVAEGGTAMFTAAGAGATDYQWRKDGVDLTDGGNVSGATTTTLTISNASKADIGAYYAVISNGCGSVLSVPAALGIQPDTNTCPADITDANSTGPDGTVNVFDLLHLLSAWGDCK